jgi:hypothetical protein
VSGSFGVPNGLRFSGDGSTLCVVDAGNGRASVFRVDNGWFVRHMATGLGGPRDVEDVEGGWLVTGGSGTVEFLGDSDEGGGGGGRPFLGKAGGGVGSGGGEFRGPTALSVVPGLGLVVRELYRLQVFATPDTIAMAAMSPVRVAWMAAVACGVLRRQQVAGTHGGPAFGVKRCRSAGWRYAPECHH